MAFTYKHKHHRNPSGCHNKVRWLLSLSKYDIKKLKRWLKRKGYKIINNQLQNGKQSDSWAEIPTELIWYDFTKTKPSYNQKDFRRFIFICRYSGIDIKLRGRKIPIVVDDCRLRLPRASGSLIPMFQRQSRT